MKRYLLLVFMVLTFSVNAQQKISEYSDLSPNFFNNYDKPIAIAVLPFTYEDSQVDLDSKFYDELSMQLGKQAKFIIHYYKKLDGLRDSWGVKNWNPKNNRLLKKLNSDLDIKLVVYAIVPDGAATSFELKVVNTVNGKEEYSKVYLPSSNTTIIKDAVMLFTENKTVNYKEVANKGAFAIKTIPEGKFQVYLNDKYVGETPFTKPDLEKGKYKIFVKDIKDAYQSNEFSFDFEPIPNKTTEKIITLKENYGSLQLLISPEEADVELYNSKNNLVKMGTGLKQIDELLVGEYKLKVKKDKYVEDASVIYITKNVVVKKEINLLPNNFKLYLVNNVVCETDAARSISLSRQGNRYTILFDVIGEPTDNFEIELYLMDKSNKSFERKLKQLTGAFGTGKFSGTGKILIWDFEKEINGGLDNNNLYLKLVVEKASGGIPWYVWAGGVVAGGVAAVLLGGKKDNGGGTTSVSIPVPPARPSN